MIDLDAVGSIMDNNGLFFQPRLTICICNYLQGNCANEERPAGGGGSTAYRREGKSDESTCECVKRKAIEQSERDRDYCLSVLTRDKVFHV